MSFVAYQYRLAPTTDQRRKMTAYAGAARLVWNIGLEQRQIAYRFTGRSPGYTAQCRELTDARAAYDWLKAVPVHVLQQSLRDLDIAFVRFYRRNARYPRFKKKKANRDSFRFPDREQIAVRRLSRKWGTVRLPKLGWCRFRWTRPLGGSVRHATVVRDVDQWFVVFCVEATEGSLHRSTGPPIGVDRGVVVAVALSTGELKAFEGWRPSELERLRRLERKRARQLSSSNNARRTVDAIGRLHRRVRRRRANFCHVVSRQLAENHRLVAIERLDTKKMTRSARRTSDSPGTGVIAKARLNRAILDKGWSMLDACLDYKCRVFGSQLVRVNPKDTSRTCAVCGHVHARNRVTRDRFRCRACGHFAHADINAAQVILQRATAAGPAVSARGEDEFVLEEAGTGSADST